MLERVVTLGGSGEPALGRMTEVAVDSRGRFFAAPTYDPGKIVMYDARGAVARTFGRPGQGPGEFGGLIHMLRVGPGDSVHVFEGTRETVLSPGIAAFGSLRMLPVLPNDLVFLPDGRTVVQRTIMGARRVGLPLHVLDAQGRIARSFGSAPVDMRNPYRGLLHLAPARGERIWSAHSAAYRIDLWGLDASRLNTLVRDVDWFPAWENQPVVSTSEARRRAKIADVAEDAQGKLWVSITVPDPHWQPPPRRGEIPSDEIDRNAEFDTILEVFDPLAGRLLAHARLGQHMAEFIGNGSMLFSRREDAAGNIVIDVWRVRLSTPEMRGRR